MDKEQLIEVSTLCSVEGQNELLRFQIVVDPDMTVRKDWVRIVLRDTVIVVSPQEVYSALALMGYRPHDND